MMFLSLTGACTDPPCGQAGLCHPGEAPAHPTARV